MQPDQILGQFYTLSRYYLQELGGYTWVEFNLKPSADSWSLGEMYNHLIETGFLQMQSLLACMQQLENRSARKSFIGTIVYGIGAIPPVRAKVPDSAKHSASPPTSKQELIDKMKLLEEQMEEVLPLVRTASPHRKIKHPYFGFLNAKEWYHHIVMHFAHHLRQKKRLDAFLNK